MVVKKAQPKEAPPPVSRGLILNNKVMGSPFGRSPYGRNSVGKSKLKLR
jgi:hypothetical protein